MTLLKRMALVIDEGRISKVWYPVFPPDRNAGDVLAWVAGESRLIYARCWRTAANTAWNISGVSTPVFVL